MHKMHNFCASHSCGFFQSSLCKEHWQIREMDGALFADSKDYLCVVYGLTPVLSSFERQHLVLYIFGIQTTISRYQMDLMMQFHCAPLNSA